MKKLTFAIKRIATKKQTKKKNQKIYPFSDDNFEDELSRIIIIQPSGKDKIDS